jgi:hypothetical protein
MNSASFIKTLWLLCACAVIISCGKKVKEATNEATKTTVDAVDVPPTVVDAFKAKYPGAVVKEWTIQDDGYEALTELNSTEYSVGFNARGEWLETEREIKYTNLPDKVKEALASSDFSSWEVKEVDEIEAPDHPFLYEIEIKSGNDKKEIYFSRDGNLIQFDKNAAAVEDRD